MCGLPLVEDPNVLVGLERPDDAGVYRLSEDTALVQTVDYFTPVVDDPRTFGRIAAANALSDVWAMGGRPVCAMNVVCFPSKEMEIEVLQEILAGGLDALREAKCALVGGHSVEAPELKYGLSVTGVVHPERVITSAGARPGDRLVLTKPLGTGVIATAIKRGLGIALHDEAGSAAAATASMAALNRRAAELMIEAGAVACTDVTGFGLIGHASEMLASDEAGLTIGLTIESGSLPLLPGAATLAEAGFLPGGLQRNRTFYSCRVETGQGVPPAIAELIYDPQTSGGLLIALAPGAAEGLIEALRAEGNEHAVVIGEFVSEHRGKVVVRA